jgi:ADP-ribose pyrophosphatase YjhB (NUDIX family)
MTDNDIRTAPADILWCCKCGTPMITREVAGKPRRACPACRHIHFIEPKVGVGVCVVQDGAILLVQRRFAPEKGKWSIPAGYLDHGDDPALHAVREVHEETGLVVALRGLAGVFHNPPEQGGASVFILYRGERTGGQLRAGDDASDAGFFAPDSLPEIAFASTRHAVALLGGDSTG